MEDTTVDDLLEKIHADAVKSSDREISKHLQCLRDLEERVLQEIKVARERILEQKVAAVNLLKKKIEKSFISELVQDKSSPENLQKCFDHLASYFQNKKWLQSSLYSLPTITNLLPQVKFQDKPVEDQVQWFNALQKLENTNTSVDSFLVEVVEVNNPSEFYIHRYCDKERKDALDYMLNNCDFQKPTEIVQGKIYAVYAQRWESWFRAQCYEQCGNFHIGNGPSQALYECFLFDEGRHEKVPSLQFGILPMELAKPKAFALSCRLHQFPNRQWTPPEIQLFKNLAALSPLNLFVFHENPGQLTVDLSKLPRFADDMSIPSFRDLLMLNQGGSPAALKKRTFRQTVVRPENGSSLQGVVTEVHSPNKIYVDVQGSDGKECFEEMMRELQGECNSSTSRLLLGVTNPAVDYCYACCWENRWFRVVLEDRAYDRMTLFFVDTGHRWTTSSSECLRQLHDKYMEIPAQVVCCKLDSISHAREKRQFSRDSVFFLRKMLINEQVTVFIRGVQAGDVGAANRRETCLYVVMYVGDDARSVNGKFADARYGRSLRTHEEPNHNRGQPERPLPVLSVDLDKYSPTPAVTVDSTTASATSNGSWLDSLAASGREDDNFAPASEETNCTDASNAAECETNATATNTNGNCAEQATNKLDPEKTSKIFEEMQTGGEQVALIQSLSWKTGGRSCDKLVSKNGKMPVTEDYAIDVIFLSCTSPDVLYVRPLLYQQLYIQVQLDMSVVYEKMQQCIKKPNFDIGFPCAIRTETGMWIRGAVADIGDEACTVRCWDDGQDYVVASEEVLPLVEPFDRIPALAICCSLSGIFPTAGRVWDRNIGAKITSMLQEAEEIVVFKEEQPESFNFPLSVQLVYKYDSDGGPLEIPGKALVNLNEKLVEMELAISLARTDAASEWPTTPAIPVPDEFSAHITWLNMDGDIFLYNVDHSEEILKEMQTSLDTKFQNSLPSSDDMKFQINDLCIARYAVDGSWYRATIIAIGERPNSVTVRFADYGTTDFVNETDIRKDLSFEDIPAQTIKCSLFDLLPADTDGEKWTKDTLDKIHPIIVDTLCIVQVKRRSPLEVSLVGRDGTDLAELFVRKGLAKFISSPSD